MAFLRAFGAYVPSRVVGNAEIGALAGSTAEWIYSVSGIEERRFAAGDETVTDMAVRAAQDCLERAGLKASEIGMLVAASGSSERRFPGPAAGIAHRLGFKNTAAIDLPMASAGSLFGMSLASWLARIHGNILIVASEKMSSIVMRQPMNRTTSVLFGDGAGACLVSPDSGDAEIVDSSLSTDGSFTEDLRLETDGTLEMNGRTVILQASRKIPRAIAALLEKNKRSAAEVGVFLMHQANQNLIDRVAEALNTAPQKFYSNIRKLGNTSSASMLIAASEWSRQIGFRRGEPVVFAAFGAGFHWGAMLAVGC